MPLHVHHLTDALEAIAPSRYAESWDNVGLLLGDPVAPFAGPTLLTIDLTLAVLDEAEEVGAGGIVAYHPPIFSPLKSLTPHAPKGRLLLRAARAGVAIVSPHTALDAAPNGVADWLIDQVLTNDAAPGAGSDRQALTPYAHLDPDQSLKLITFIPAEPDDLAARLIDALSAAGAGQIGDYSHCAFTTPGQGSFLGGAGTNPTIGKAGALERVDELRLEVVVSRRALPGAIVALRETHPYEEPPIDIVGLEARPDRSIGAGRAASLDEPVPLEQLGVRLKRALDVRSVRIADASEQPIHRVGVCPGSGGSLVDAALAAGCQAFITGEMTHHNVLSAMDQGLSIILAGHTNTERGYLPHLADRLRDIEPGLDPRVSVRDRWPLAEV